MVPTDEERRYQISSARFCSQTFVEEKDLPQGQKLLTCGRCRETCYVSREAQLENWPHHKHSCRRLSEDHPVVRDSQGFESSIHCLNEIQNCLQNPLGKIRGRLLLYGLQQLLTSANCGSLTMTRGGDEIPIDASEYQQFVESIFQKVIALLGSAFDSDFGPAKEIAHRLWSIPGFTNFFLSEDRFLSAAMKRWKLEGIPPPPMNKQEENDGSIQLPSTSTNFVSKLLGQSDLALAGRAEDSKNLIVSTTAFGAAVERRFLECWQCPYSRASVPLDAFEGVSRDRFFLCALCGMFRLGIRNHRPNSNTEDDSPTQELENAKSALSSRTFKRENEVMCGITMKDAFRVILEDEHIVDQCHSNPTTACLTTYTLIALGDTFREGKSNEAPWKFFTFRDRIDLLELFQEHVFSEKSARPNDPIISVLAYWCTAVLGFSASTVFGVYDTLTGPSCRGKVRPQTTKLVQKKRQELLEEPRKKVQVYLDVIEPAYLRRQLRLKVRAMPFPDELADHIAAYLANEQVDLPILTIIESMINGGQA